MTKLNYILSIYTTKLPLSYLVKFIHYWNELGIVRIIIMKKDLEMLKQEALNQPSESLDSDVFIPYEPIKDIPDKYTLALLNLFYPCILDKEVTKTVLVVPIGNIIRDIDTINCFEQKIQSNSNKFIKYTDKENNYYCSQIKNWIDIFKIRDVSNSNFTIAYLYNSLENDLMEDNLMNHFLNRKMDMWREKRNLYLEINLTYNDGTKVENLIHKLLNNGIPFKNKEINELNELSNFNVILPYPSYRDINDYILDKYFNKPDKILVI